jgi:hypothetical protein
MQGFHPELTKPKVVAACPPSSLKPCNPYKPPPLTTTTSAGDCTTAPHSAVLSAKRADLAVVEGAISRCTPGAAAPASSSPVKRHRWRCRPTATCRLHTVGDTSATSPTPPRRPRVATLASLNVGDPQAEDPIGSGPEVAWPPRTRACLREEDGCHSLGTATAEPTSGRVPSPFTAPGPT